MRLTPLRKLNETANINHLMDTLQPGFPSHKQIIKLIQQALLLGIVTNAGFLAAATLVSGGQSPLMLYGVALLAAQLLGLVLLSRGFHWLRLALSGALITVLTAVGPFLFGVIPSLLFAAILLSLTFGGLMLAQRGQGLLTLVGLLVWTIVFFLAHTSTPLWPLTAADAPVLWLLESSIILFLSAFMFLLGRLLRSGMRAGRAHTQLLHDTISALRASTASRLELDNIVESISELLVVTDTALRIQRVNQATAQALSYTATALIGRPLHDILPGLEIDLKKLEKDERRVVHCESKCLTRSHRSLPVSMTISLLRDEAHEVVGLICVARDISELKRMASQLAISHERYQRAMSATQGGVLEWHIINDSMYVDPNVLHSLGYDPTDTRFNDPQAFRSLIPDAYREHVEAQYHAHIMRQDTRYEMEYPLRHRDGHHLWHLTRGHIRYTPGGQAHTVTASIFNIEARRQMEARLRQSEAKTRALFESIPDMILRMDREGRYLEIVGAQNFDPVRPLEELIDLRMHDVLPMEVSDKLLTALHAVLEDQQTRVVQYDLPTSDDETQDSFEARIIFNTPDEVLMIVSLINERKQIERQAVDSAVQQEKERLLARFVQDVSHDFRTSLSVITTSVYLLQRMNDPAKQQERVAVIEQQAVRMARLFESLFAMMRLDTAPQMHYQRTDINRLVIEVMERLQKSADAHGLTMRLDIDPDLPRIIADESKLGQAVINIVDNAILFNQPGGEVRVRTYRHNTQVLAIQINDTGMGIPEAQQKAVFERLYKVDAARTRTEPYTGIGLGLPIAQRIIRLHQGRILLQSQVDQGSTFTILLPLSSGEQDSAESDDPDASENSDAPSAPQPMGAWVRPLEL